jgi:hypothetical protein
MERLLKKKLEWNKPILHGCGAANSNWLAVNAAPIEWAIFA